MAPYDVASSIRQSLPSEQDTMSLVFLSGNFLAMSARKFAFAVCTYTFSSRS